VFARKVKISPNFRAKPRIVWMNCLGRGNTRSSTLPLLPQHLLVYMYSRWPWLLVINGTLIRHMRVNNLNATSTEFEIRCCIITYVTIYVCRYITNKNINICLNIYIIFINLYIYIYTHTHTHTHTHHTHICDWFFRDLTIITLFYYNFYLKYFFMFSLIFWNIYLPATFKIKHPMCVCISLICYNTTQK